MASKRFGLDFDGIGELSTRIEKMGGDLKNIATDALTETHKMVTAGVENAMNVSPYNFNRTGRTKKSLQRQPKIEWAGLTASVGVGFDISNGGLASIFLMHGTPTITPDKNLYNSIFGTKTAKRVRELQQEIFLNQILDGVKK